MSEGDSMAPEALRSWLDRRRPRAPSSFLPHLLDEDGDRPMGPRELTEAGIRAIEDALAHPGRDRCGAFRLLVGDAYLTYACEALAEEGDALGGLEELLRRVGEGCRP